MNKLLLILLFFVPTILFAQKTKKITNHETKETFYVLKSDKKIRHGEYKKYNFLGNLSVSGYYKLGVRDSIWECFDRKGEPVSKYNFTKNELLFINSKAMARKKDYRLIVNGHKLDTTLSRPPVFLGGDELIISEIKYPTSAIKAGVSDRVVIVFTVDKFGKTTDYHVKTSSVKALDKEVLRALQLIPDFWLPGYLNGEPVDVEVEFPFTFKNFGTINLSTKSLSY
jgi:TonB family C-terminal domain